MLLLSLFLVPIRPIPFLPQSDEPVDCLPALRQECIKKCPVEVKNYEACKDRIKAKGSGDCEAWYFDMLKCVDKCVVPQVFKNTK